MIKLLKKIKWICFVCCIFLIQQGFSQHNKIDSLKRNFKFSKKEEKVNIFLQLSELNLKTNFDSALYWADMALAESRILNNRKFIFKSFLQRALVFKDKSLYDSVLSTIHFALNYAAEDKKAMGDAYEALGAAHGTLGNYDSSSIYFNNALVCYQETKDSSAIAKVYGSLGLVHIKKGEFENAIEKTFKALEIAEKIGDKKQIGWTANSLGGIYWYLLEDSLALLYYKKSLDIYTQLKDDFGIASANSNIGGVFQEVKDYTNAVFHYQKALDVFIKLNNKLGISAIYMNFGDLYSTKGDWEAAILNYQKSLEINKEVGDKWRTASLYRDIGKIYLRKKDYKNAYYNLNYSMQYAKLIDAKKILKDNYLYLSMADSALGKYADAYKHFKIYSNYKDSIFNTEKSKQIAEIRTRYETEKKERENVILRKELEIKMIKDAKNRNFLRFLFFISLILLVLVLLLLRLFRLRNMALKKHKLLLEREKQLSEMQIKNKENENKILITEKEKEKIENLLLMEELKAQQEITMLQKEKHEADLQLKNKELSSLMLQFINKNEILGKIKIIILEELKNPNADFHAGLQKTLSEIQNNIDMEIDWKKFKINFEAVHGNFFERLNESFPGLTSNEQKLAGYLRMNLTSGEIAQIMSISVDSVSKNRQRLKKKLNIFPERELKDFIQEF